MAFDWDVLADRRSFTEVTGILVSTAKVLRETEWRQHIHPEDQPRQYPASKVLSRTAIDFIAFRYRRPDGGEVWLEKIASV